LSTDLGAAFESHEATYRGDRAYRLADYDVAWLNVMRDRARKQSDVTLTDFTDKMLALLLNPQAAGQSFQKDFRTLHDDARRRAYAATTTVKITAWLTNSVYAKRERTFRYSR